MLNRSPPASTRLLILARRVQLVNQALHRCAPTCCSRTRTYQEGRLELQSMLRHALPSLNVVLEVAMPTSTVQGTLQQSLHILMVTVTRRAAIAMFRRWLRTSCCTSLALRTTVAWVIAVRFFFFFFLSFPVRSLTDSTLDSSRDATTNLCFTWTLISNLQIVIPGVRNILHQPIHPSANSPYSFRVRRHRAFN